MEEIKKGQIPVFALFLLCCIIAIQPIALSSPGYVTVGTNVKFKASNTEGPLLFSSSVQATQITFSGEYVQFSNLRFAGAAYAWSSIGFTVSSNANMTVSQTNADEIKYTVNSPAGNQSISRVSFPSTRTIQNVTGANSWNQADNVLTVYVTHSSPQEIIVSWASNIISTGVDTVTNILALMFPLLFITSMFAMIKHPDEARTILTIAVLIMVMGFFSWLFYTWRM